MTGVLEVVVVRSFWTFFGTLALLAVLVGGLSACRLFTITRGADDEGDG